MRKILVLTAFVMMIFSAGTAYAQQTDGLRNPAIDMEGFLKNARAASKHREKRRLTEDQFIAMSKEQDVVILDARSKERFDELHIKGAVNLSFPDITVDSLAMLLPNKNTKILIYCNNNFENEPEAFRLRSPAFAQPLNLYLALHLRLPQRL